VKIISRAEAGAKGLKRYFTGKPCLRGHVSERFVRSKDCMQCRMLSNRARYSDPKKHEDIIAKHRKAARRRYLLNPEPILSRNRKNRAARTRKAFMALRVMELLGIEI
jgi:hypothetical protein